MYITTRNPDGGTLITCKDCGHAVTMNKTCERPLQSATDMLKHMAAHNASRAFAPAPRVTEPSLAPEAKPVSEPIPELPATQHEWIPSIPQSPN